MARPRGISVRLRLTLSYVAVVMLAAVLLLSVVWLFLLRYIPDGRLYDLDGPAAPNRSDLIRAFTPAALLMLAALLLLALLGGWVIAGRVLAPLDRLTQATRRAAGGSLSHRIDMPGRADEFRELADAFDAMLSRLEAHVEGQRRFAANASHELRTPLAITQSMLEVAQRDPSHDPAELLRRLDGVNRRAIELTEALLLLSRADHGTFARERVDLSLLAEEAMETLIPLAEARGVELDVSGDVAVAVGSPALLLQLTTNLVHNAIVHNLGEAGRGSVVVRTGVERQSALLIVENTGPTVEEALLATLVEPFQRGVSRTVGDRGGVGLGLAIVDAIVRAHAGTLHLVAQPSGGLRITVELPRAGG